MLRIRKTQMEALSAEMVVGFTGRMESYLLAAFPEWCGAMGGDELRAFVAHGVLRAREYGFGVELDVAQYILAMRALGMRFDEDPALSWARDLLTRRLLPAERVGRLQDAVRYECEARRIRNAH
jgi:hypothetical protein